MRKTLKWQKIRCGSPVLAAILSEFFPVCIFNQHVMGLIDMLFDANLYAISSAILILIERREINSNSFERGN